MDFSEFSYSEDAALEKLIKSVNRPGDFYAQGRLVVPMPRLEIDGIGMLSFPVPEMQVRSLIAGAERAPYGRGSDTLVDTSVRDCFQIGAERIRLAGDAWQDTFARILVMAAEGLGYPADRVDANLYKLLIYEHGGFFSPHRDSEKEDGMIATLSVSLPVVGKGGALVIRHGDRESVVEMNVEEPSEIAFAAFYADCLHEVRPVVEGHRLSLVFNLRVRPDDTDTPRLAPDYNDQFNQIAQHLVKRQESGLTPDKLVWMLEHEYSKAGLSFDALKNADATKAAVLVAAAERAGWDIFAAIIHIHEEGSATYNGHYIHYWDHDENDTEGVDIDEIFDLRIRLNSWITPAGRHPGFGDLELEDEELLPQGVLDNAIPDEQLLHEATGNAGVSLERSYRLAALVLWPRSSAVSILFDARVGAAVDWVALELDRHSGKADDRIRRTASKLVDLWATQQPRPTRSDEEDTPKMLHLLCRIGDSECMAHFLDQVVASRYTGSENEWLPAAMELSGVSEARKFLSKLIEDHFRKKPKQILELLVRIRQEQGDSRKSMWREILLQSVCSVLRTVSREPDFRTEIRSDQSRDERIQETAGLGRNGTAVPDPRFLKAFDEQSIRNLFGLAWQGGLTKEAEAAARAIAALPELATPDRILPAALCALNTENGFANTVAYATLWGHAARFLQNRSAVSPKEPTHWRIEANRDCKCDNCARLVAFCHDPDARVGRFSLRQDLRSHLEMSIESNNLEIDYRTERRGSPHTLVCTKNRAGFKRRLNEYADDVSWMRRLIRISPGGEMAVDCASELAGLHEAVAAQSPD